MKNGKNRLIWAIALAVVLVGLSLTAIHSTAALSPTSYDAPRATSTRWDDYVRRVPTSSSYLSSSYYDDDDDDDDDDTSSGSSSSSSSSSKTYTVKSGGNRGVTSEKAVYRSDGSVKLTSVTSKSNNVVIGSTVKLNDKKAKVTAIGANAFKNCPKMTSLTLPKTLRLIGKNAFKGAKNLKVIKLNITKSIKVVKGAFAGLNTENMTIRVSKKMSANEVVKFIKVLRKAGFRGKVK